MTSNRRRDRVIGLGIVAAAVFALDAGSTFLIARTADIPLREVALYFDGHLYLEIARSFPLPYGRHAAQYAGHAPLYPACIALVHRLLGLDFGTAALLVSWTAGAAASVVFVLVLETLGLPITVATMAFVAAYSYWRVVTATAHPEPIAMLAVLLATLASLRERDRAAAWWLSLAVLARFPALLVAPALAWRTRGWAHRALVIVCPLVTLLLWNLYIEQRVGISISEGNRTYWLVALTWPFEPFRHVDMGARWLSFAVAAVGMASLLGALAMRQWWLAIWIGLTVIGHAMLGGPGVHMRTGVAGYPRYVLLIWPAVVLLVARAIVSRPRLRPLVGAAVVALAILGTRWVVLSSAFVISMQAASMSLIPEARGRLDSDVATWPQVTWGPATPPRIHGRSGTNAGAAARPETLRDDPAW